MRQSIFIAMMAMVSATAHADNIADCEVLIRQNIKVEDQKSGAFIDTYLPATDFIASVYDEEDGHITQANGENIVALFCTRHEVLPTLRDFPLLATGIPFAASTDFDASDSAMIFIRHDGEKFIHAYQGPDLSPERAAQLTDAMEVFNLQPHDLGK